MPPSTPCPARRPAPAPGFTLIEAVIALALVGLLLGLAVPAIGNARHASHAGAARAALLESLLVASSRAATTATHVVLCASVDGATCRGTPDWSRGWIVFADVDGDGTRGGADPLVGHQPALGGTARLRSTAGRTRLVFQPNGGNAGSNVTFTLCDGRGPAEAVSLVLANSGRLRGSEPSQAAAAACLAD